MTPGGAFASTVGSPPAPRAWPGRRMSWSISTSTVRPISVVTRECADATAVGTSRWAFYRNSGQGFAAASATPRPPRPRGRARRLVPFARGHRAVRARRWCSSGPDLTRSPMSTATRCSTSSSRATAPTRSPASPTGRSSREHGRGVLRRPRRLLPLVLARARRHVAVAPAGLPARLIAQPRAPRPAFDGDSILALAPRSISCPHEPSVHRRDGGCLCGGCSSPCRAPW